MSSCDFLIIDTYNMIIRSKMPWTRVENENLVILSFLQMLKKTIDYFQPTKVIMPIDDYIGNSFRRVLLPEYKAFRSARNEKDPFSEDFKKQKEIILKLLELYLPVYTLKYKGYEADDLIAMISNIVSDDVNIVIWSNDNDLVQIQQKLENVKLWNPHQKDFVKNPNYDYVTYKSLIGKRNEMPGVKGIGKKTAEKVMSSAFEFIRLIASQPQRYVEYRLNRRVVDLLDNELPVPKNIHYILNTKTKYNGKAFEEFILEYKHANILNQMNYYHETFNKLQIKNNTNKREWFFNKKGIIR